MNNPIFSIAFTKDNQRAFISDYYGKIKMIMWVPNASTENDFDLTQASIIVGKGRIFLKICLTGDDKNLLVGSEKLLTVFSTETRKIIREIKLNHYVRGMKVDSNSTNVLIAEGNGNITIINTDSMEVVSGHMNADNGKGLWSITLI